MLPPFSIACPFRRVFSSVPSIYRPLPLHRYGIPVEVPPAADMSVEIFGDGEKIL